MRYCDMAFEGVQRPGGGGGEFSLLTYMLVDRRSVSGYTGTTVSSRPTYGKTQLAMQGTLAGFLTLTHFGRTDGDPEERTVQFWILPGDMAGLPVDEPGCVLLRGWPKHGTTSWLSGFFANHLVHKK